MKKFTCILSLGMAVLQSAGAADKAPAAKPVASAATPIIELKNKSSFSMEDNARNPFWPIGWKPTAKATDRTEHVGPEISPSSFLVSSITLDAGAKFAIVNGKVMQEGQVFGLQMGSQTYQITLKSIQDGRVILLRRDEEIEVPLHRK